MEYVYTCKMLWFKGHAVKKRFTCNEHLWSRYIYTVQDVKEKRLKLKWIAEESSGFPASARFRLYVTGVMVTGEDQLLCFLLSCAIGDLELQHADSFDIWFFYFIFAIRYSFHFSGGTKLCSHSERKYWSCVIFIGFIFHMVPRVPENGLYLYE